MESKAFMLVCWWGWGWALQAATWYVAESGDDSANNGTGGWDQAYATISNAVVHANTNAATGC